MTVARDARRRRRTGARSRPRPSVRPANKASAQDTIARCIPPPPAGAGRRGAPGARRMPPHPPHLPVDLPTPPPPAAGPSGSTVALDHPLLCLGRRRFARSGCRGGHRRPSGLSARRRIRTIACSACERGCCRQAAFQRPRLAPLPRARTREWQRAAGQPAAAQGATPATEWALGSGLRAATRSRYWRKGGCARQGGGQQRRPTATAAPLQDGEGAVQCSAVRCDAGQFPPSGARS